jgi:inosine-uridine nucleoside N-ribohydrolase
MVRKLVSITLLCSVIATNAHAQKVIIDCDPGIDDAMAIILAMEYSDFEILGITTVFGNATAEQATANALKIVELSGMKIPVYEGAKRPLVIPLGKPPDFVHGTDGLGNTGQAESNLRVESASAAEFIVETINTHPGEITVLAIGRLTNLANALALDPGIATKVKDVILMGGALHVPGNVTPVAEANISGDPHAADLVFRASWPVTMIGLDVTTKLIMDDQFLETIRKKNAQYGKFIYDISRFYLNFHITEEGVEGGFYVHDPSAVMYLINPGIFRMKKGPVRVVTTGIGIGQTIIATYGHHLELEAWKDQAFTSAAIEVDDTSFFEEYRRIMTSD